MTEEITGSMLCSGNFVWDLNTLSCQKRGTTDSQIQEVTYDMDIKTECNIRAHCSGGESWDSEKCRCIGTASVDDNEISVF